MCRNQSGVTAADGLPTLGGESPVIRANMAEGGSEEVNNNLSRCQDEKMMPNKNVSTEEGFSELHTASGFAQSHISGGLTIPERPVYSQDSGTYLKAALDAAPPLTPLTSVIYNSQTNSLEQLTSPGGTSEQSVRSVCGGGETVHGSGTETQLTSTSTGSTRQDGASLSEDSCEAEPLNPGSASNANSTEKTTNDLSAGKTPTSAFGAAHGFVHSNITFLPVSIIPSGASQFMGVVPMPIPMHTMVGGSQTISVAPQNISCPRKLNCEAGAATMDASYFPSGSTYDSRNIPPARNGSAPSSAEDNNSSASYSVNPTGTTHLTRLRKPVLDWIRKKLDAPHGSNWEALADVRGWKYEDIMAHLNESRHNQRSPFLSLLDTETFVAYTVDMFCEDMKLIKRIDILREFGSVLQKANAAL